MKPLYTEVFTLKISSYKNIKNELWIDRIPLAFSRCSNNTCQLKDNCLRWLDIPEERYSISKFEPSDDRCSHQIKPDTRTETKAETLLKTFTKKELSEQLGISRPTLYSRIVSGRWKKLEEEKIKQLFNKI